MTPVRVRGAVALHRSDRASTIIARNTDTRSGSVNPSVVDCRRQRKTSSSTRQRLAVASAISSGLVEPQTVRTAGGTTVPSAKPRAKSKDAASGCPLSVCPGGLPMRVVPSDGPGSCGPRYAAAAGHVFLNLAERANGFTFADVVQSWCQTSAQERVICS